MFGGAGRKGGNEADNRKDKRSKSYAPPHGHGHGKPDKKTPGETIQHQGKPRYSGEVPDPIRSNSYSDKSRSSGGSQDYAWTNRGYEYEGDDVAAATPPYGETSSTNQTSVEAATAYYGALPADHATQHGADPGETVPYHEGAAYYDPWNTADVPSQSKSSHQGVGRSSALSASQELSATQTTYTGQIPDSTEDYPRTYSEDYPEQQPYFNDPDSAKSYSQSYSKAKTYGKAPANLETGFKDETAIQEDSKWGDDGRGFTSLLSTKPEDQHPVRIDEASGDAKQPFELTVQFKKKSDDWCHTLGYFDTGNKLGHMIELSTVLDMGYVTKDINDDMREFKVIGGARVKTHGQITLKYKVEDTEWLQIAKRGETEFHVLGQLMEDEDYQVLISPKFMGLKKPMDIGGLTQIPMVVASQAASRKLTKGQYMLNRKSAWRHDEVLISQIEEVKRQKEVREQQAAEIRRARKAREERERKEREAEKEERRTRRRQEEEEERRARRRQEEEEERRRKDEDKRKKKGAKKDYGRGDTKYRKHHEDDYDETGGAGAAFANPTFANMTVQYGTADYGQGYSGYGTQGSTYGSSSYEAEGSTAGNTGYVGYEYEGDASNEYSIRTSHRKHHRRP